MKINLSNCHKKGRKPGSIEEPKLGVKCFLEQSLKFISSIANNLK